jgi:hypothetical protein
MSWGIQFIIFFVVLVSTVGATEPIVLKTGSGVLYGTLETPKNKGNYSA